PSQFVWGAEVPMLSDGVTSVLGLAQESGGGSSEAYIQGTYVSPEGAKPAYLVFDISDLSYSGMLTITNESPSAVSPNPGDQFIVDMISIEDGNVTVTPLVDAPLTFGIQPFTLSYQPAASGTYEIGLSITDLAGNKIYKKTTLDVDNSPLNGDLRGSTDINTGVYFQYPREWGDSNTIANDDGSVTYTVGSKAGDQTIFVDVYPDTDTAAALAATMETYPAQYGSITETTFAQMPAQIVDFTFESDNGTVTGALISILNAENGSAVVFALQATSEGLATLTNLIDLLDQSIILFKPLDA
ncbi:MAG: hypothetical protein K8I60_07760, partial [Anaerolineae bacterium]|nr:hypothetical protein [Anaerolineae bacterium]